MWTLRFESKHSYFKKCVRHACNFKNVCSTLALRHQLFQSYISAGNFFRSKITVIKSINFSTTMFSSDIKNSLPNSMNSLNSVVSDNTIVNGICYQKDLFLPLKTNEEGIIFGKIKIIIVFNDTEVYFVTEQFQGVYSENYGVYAIVPINSKFSCEHISNLLDYYPLPAYLFNKFYCICLHHACE